MLPFLLLLGMAGATWAQANASSDFNESSAGLGAAQKAQGAARDTVRGRYCYAYGEDETLRQAKDKAFALAQRQAIRSYRVYVESVTRVENLQLKEDLVQSAAAGVLRDVQIESEEQRKQEYCVAITAKINPVELQQFLERRLQSTGARAEGVTIPALQPRPAAGAVMAGATDGLNYVWIPPGTFLMGCSPGDSECRDSEKPAHRVTITKGFWMGQTEVTVGAYKRFAAAAGRAMPAEPKAGDRPLNPGWSDDQQPMATVTWDDAAAHCRWAGGRLPTEAEWEYAARGGTSGSRYGDLDAIAWYADNSGRSRLDSVSIVKQDPKGGLFHRLMENQNGSHKVGQKLPNALGLYDMLGNVWEWVADWYGENYYGQSPSQDPPGPSSGQSRVSRGGSSVHGPWGARASYRSGGAPGNRYNDAGFRCVREVP